MNKVKIEGFDTFRDEDGLERPVTKVLVERDEDTGNYFVELFGKNLDGEYIIDAEELINFKEVMVYLTYLGRDYGGETMSIKTKEYLIEHHVLLGDRRIKFDERRTGKSPKKYKIYFDYEGSCGLGKVYQGTTDDLDAWLEEGNKLIRESDGLLQEETLDDYIIEEEK
jgi:hypothetical protein